MDMSWSNYPSPVLRSESKILHGAAHTDADADAMSDIRYRHWTVVSLPSRKPRNTPSL